MEAKPALQMSTKTKELDISETDSATRVYVKIEEPRGLSARFEGPFEVVSQPSRSQVQVRVGSYANGEPRLLIYHWSSCRVAHMREEATEGTRPRLGRKPALKEEAQKVPDPPVSPRSHPPSASSTLSETNKKEGAKIQTVPSPPTHENENLQSTSSGRTVRSTRNAHPRYLT